MIDGYQPPLEHPEHAAHQNGSSAGGPFTRPPKPERVQPHNLEAEEALLGAMLLSRDAIAVVADTGLIDRDFYRPAHGHIYDATMRLHNAGEPVDVTTVADELARHHLLDQAGGHVELAGIMSRTPATSSAGRYARIIADTALLRRLIATAAEIAEIGYSRPDDIATAVDTIEQLIYDATRNRTSAGTTRTLHDALDTHLTLLEARVEGTVPDGVPTGLDTLDEIIGGLHAGQLIIGAGRPGMGKTALGLAVGANTARAGHTTLWTSIEMGEPELLDRILASASHLNQTTLRTGKLGPNDWARLSHAIGRIAEHPLVIDDHPGATVARIASKARRTKDLALVVVDYLQLVTPGARSENRQVEIAEISTALKRLARDLKIPVLALAQLNRSVEQRADKRPQLSDLRDSGQIEQDADVVIGLYREEVYKPDTPEKGVLEAIVLKQRNGPLGTARLSYHVDSQRITDLARSI